MAANEHDWPEIRHAGNHKVLGLMRENLVKWLKSQPSIAPSDSKRFNDFEELDETLRTQALSFELASLSQAIGNDGTANSEYARLLAEVIRLECSADFSLLPVSIIVNTREPLQVITPARVISDISTAEGVKILEVKGEDLQRLLKATQASATPIISFSGLSIETSSDGEMKIFPWAGNFEADNIYKIAVNENFKLKLEGHYDLSSCDSKKRFNDIRRCFINGLRRRNGQVEIRRAIY